MSDLATATFAFGFLLLMIVIYSPLAKGQPHSKLALWDKTLNDKRRAFLGTAGLALVVISMLSLKGLL